MESFQHIKDKLKEFIRKYYLNELVKGAILFLSLGVLYFIITLLLEHFLWLEPTGRTLLFWGFVAVELGLAVYYIIIPLLKLSGLKEGISSKDASTIIGKHFPEVSDKLLNIIQLNENESHTELIDASIQQKSSELSPIPFRRAINFTTNKKYLKYALLPIGLWGLLFFTGQWNGVNSSLDRVVHYSAHYSPPAPFSFQINNETLEVLEGASFNIQIEVIGELIPNEVKIYFLNEQYYLENKGNGSFQYQFNGITKDLDFYLEAGEVQSSVYTLKSIPTPMIDYLKMVLQYPPYTGKVNEVIEHTGNATVPKGTTVSWQVETSKTESVKFQSTTEEDVAFNRVTQRYFNHQQTIENSIDYAISSSNSYLQNYESLEFTIQSVLDEHPKILVKSDIDSVETGPVQFAGQVSDDYAIRKLQLVYYNKREPENLFYHDLNISNTGFTEFYLIFPDSLSIGSGEDYELYFEVFDNDGYMGSKKTKSRIFSYYEKTADELREAVLNKQKESLENIDKTLKKAEDSNEELDRFKEELQKKGELNWNDVKKLDQYMDRQAQYQEMFMRRTDELQRNVDELPAESNMVEKKEALLDRIQELKELQEQEKLLEELDKLGDKLQREDMIEKLKKLSERSRNNKKDLERLVELTKRFYVEQKTNQIADKLDSLSKKQDNLAEQELNDGQAKEQQDIKEEFKKEKEALEELKKENEELNRPMKLPDTEEDTDAIEQLLDELERAMENEDSESESNEEGDENEKGDQNEQQKKAKQNQKKAAQKMKSLAEKMKQSMMQMEGEMIDENIEDLRKIVENLIEFSFQQENLMDKFRAIDNNHPDYPRNLRRQHLLKDYFEHIDDSLYTLSLRMVQMGSNIQKEVYNAQYNIDESLSNFTENRFEQGTSNQQFVITSANNLANDLSNLLEQLQNASMQMGKGEGDGRQEFTLPDIIQKQGELNEEMKQKGEQQGQQGQGDEEMNGELFEIFKEQAKLREMLKELLGGDQINENSKEGDAVKKMEEIEQELLDKGLSRDLIQKAIQLNYELLKLEKARKEQGLDTKRISNTNSQSYQRPPIKKLNLKPPYFNYDEILQRQSLPLRTPYKKKVLEYFKKEQ